MAENSLESAGLPTLSVYIHTQLQYLKLASVYILHPHFLPADHSHTPPTRLLDNGHTHISFLFLSLFVSVLTHAGMKCWGA